MSKKGYAIPKETFIVVGGELRCNPERESRLELVELPMGEFEDLRVRVALVRDEDYGLHDDVVISDSEDIFNLMKSMAFEPQETIHIIMLDARNIVIGIQEVFRGGSYEMVIEPKLLFQAPILADAVSLIFVHNHPSGAPKPSSVDQQMTHNFAEASRLLGFRFLDHVIIGDGDYASFADIGLI